MKTKIVAIGAALALLAIGTVWSSGDSARADNGPHIANQSVTTDACAGCHRAHTAAAPDLLKASETTLCFTCHDGTAALTKPDAGKTTDNQALRAGGFNTAYVNTADQTWSRHTTTPACASGQDSHEYGSGSSNTPTTPTCGTWTNAQKLLLDSILALDATGAGQPVTSRHEVQTPTQNLAGSPTKAIYGGTGTLALKCTSCHDPHGNQQYRILRPAPLSEEGAGTDKFATATTPVAPDTVSVVGVRVVDEATHVYGTSNYFDVGYVASTANMTTPLGISAWCAQCHTKYLANTGAWGDLTKSGDGVNYMHATTSYAPSCIKCHTGHGTNAVISGGSGPAGLNYAGTLDYPNGDAHRDANNTRMLKIDNRGICQKCHKR